MKELEKRNLPDVLRMNDVSCVQGAAQWSMRRKEIMEILKTELFGTLPRCEYTWQCEVEREENHYYHGGKSLIRIARMDVTINEKFFSWKFHYSLPKSEKPVPVFLMPTFTKLLPVDSIPTEEICDNGFGITNFDYQSISTDDGDFTNGLSGLFYPDGARETHDGGKISVWAWAVMRMMDYLTTVPEIDKDRIYIVGHSRLGKTALWAGALDERFAGVISVQSGCGGAALARGNTGETVRNITEKFSFWFAPAYTAYADNETAMPFDQHFLLAMAAPRKLYVTSAAGDLWADPLGEYLACVAVEPVYAACGLSGVPEREALGDEAALNGEQAGYFRRKGTHFFSRTDWHAIMNFLSEGEKENG